MFIIRDKDGFVTDEQMDELYKSLPIVVGLDDDESTFEMITKYNFLDYSADLQKPDSYNCWFRIKIERQIEQEEMDEIVRKAGYNVDSSYGLAYRQGYMDCESNVQKINDVQKK